MILVIGFITAAFTHYLYGGIVCRAPEERSTAGCPRAPVGDRSAVLVLCGPSRTGRPLQPGDRGRRRADHRHHIHRVHAVLPAKGDPGGRRASCARCCSSPTIWTRSWRLPARRGRRRSLSSSSWSAASTRRSCSGSRCGPRRQTREAAVHPAQHRRDTRRPTASTTCRRQTYDATDRRRPPASCAATPTTVPGIRLIDPNVVSPDVQAAAAEQGYYQFADVARRRPLHDRRQVAATPSSPPASST